MFEMCRLSNSDMAAANLRFGSCQALVDSGSVTAKLGFGNCHILIYSGLETRVWPSYLCAVSPVFLNRKAVLK